MLTVEQVRDALDYDPETGVFTWKKALGDRKREDLLGSRAGYIQPQNGYRWIKLLQNKIAAQRLAWAHYHGKWPDGEVDHINHIRDDNRISNLRDVSSKFNAKHNKLFKNNTSGVAGVGWHKASGKWRVRIGNKYLGLCDTLIDAVAARMQAEKEHGYNDPEHPSNV